jgi:hypothetical protein
MTVFCKILYTKQIKNISFFQPFCLPAIQLHFFFEGATVAGWVLCSLFTRGSISSHPGLPKHRTYGAFFAVIAALCPKILGENYQYSFDHCVIPTTEEEESADTRDSSSLRFPRNDTFFQLSSPHFAQNFGWGLEIG